MKSLFKQIAVGAAAIALIAGCGGGSATPSTSSTAPAAQPSASVATAQSAAPAPTSAATGTAASSGPSPVPPTGDKHADPALEALLPAEVSGTPMQLQSYSFAEVFASGGDRATVDAFLQSIGKSEDDGTTATALDPTNKLPGGIIAFRIAGADPAVLLPAIVSVEQSDLGAGATSKQATVGGKSVTVVSVGSGVNDTEWVYGSGDVVFVVHASDEAGAALFLQALS